MLLFWRIEKKFLEELRMKLRRRLQNNPLNWHSAGMFTEAIDRYQALFILSCVLRIAGVFLFVPRFAVDNEKKPKDLLRHMLRSLLGPAFADR